MTFPKNKKTMEGEAGRERGNFDRVSFSMNHIVEFQMVCIVCNGLAIRIEDPVRASREAIVFCGDCGASRGTVGALRDLAVRPNAHAVSPKATIPDW